ncbi:rubrerythrin [Peribacillus deserti]|uniref:Rubrerythrin n=1 Tax=Peribacillus deserti TaxID=673318 RepID=A0ABS2QL21_9BACI|nr:nuclease-related domain-containing protein [Peribacillus deserti]MBM7693464.1 rubrerythrin [Peribacillus deserti]
MEMKIQQIEALLRRLPRNHAKRPELEVELAKRWAGYKGEQSIDYHLKGLRNHEYLILHDLNLNCNSSQFQIDTLILSSSYGLLLEIKNISGTLFFDQNFNQLIRTLNNKEEGFNDPISQAQRHQNLFNEWLSINGIAKFPIEALVIISNPSTIIKTDRDNQDIYSKVCHAAQLLSKLKQLEARFQKKILSHQKLFKLSDLLVSLNSPPESNALDIFKINRRDLIKGVICPHCNYKPLARQKGTWVCPSCSCTSKHGHKEAIRDYFLLVSPVINNRDLRDMLQINSRHTAKYLLKQLPFQLQGQSKGSYYHPPPNKKPRLH